MVSLIGGIELGQKLGDWRIGAAAGAFGAFYIAGTSLALPVVQQAENQERPEDNSET